MSNRFERLAIAMAYFTIHPASEDETRPASEVRERKLLDPFDPTKIHGLDNVLYLAHLQNSHPLDLVHDVEPLDGWANKEQPPNYM